MTAFARSQQAWRFVGSPARRRPYRPKPEPPSIIDNFTFKPDIITVPVGTTVVWENDDNIVHTVVSRDGAFRSPALDTEDKFSFTFDKTGTFEYFCSLHPYMKAKVVVAP
jgi:plastocyanin